MRHHRTLLHLIVAAVLIALLAIPVLGTTPAQGATSRVTQVTVKEFAGKTVIGIVATGRILYHMSELAPPPYPRVVVDLLDAVLDPSARITINVGKDHVLAVRTGQFQDSPPIARVVIDLARAIPVEIQQTSPNVLIVNVPTAPVSARAPVQPTAAVPTGTGVAKVAQQPGQPAAPEIIQLLEFRGTALADVLAALAKLCNFNVVTDGSVQGTITLRLVSVTCEEALRFILEANNLGFRRLGKNIIVSSAEKLAPPPEVPETVAYRAPGSPISAYAVESTMDAAAKKIGMDPLQFRLKNIAKPGTQLVYGAKIAHEGFAETLQALQRHPGYTKPLGKNQGRGMAVGYWFNGGGESSATVHVNEDGTAVVATGSPDIGGSRASTAQMAAETLGIEYERVRPIIADTNSVGYTQATGGSRVTYATGRAVIGACNKVIAEMCARAAKIWKIDVEDVIWEDGFARPAGKRAGEFPPLSFKDIASKRTATGGPIVAASAINADGQGPGFAAQFCDVEVDPETGQVKILRYVAAQDAGRAVHPKYVEGQIQGGVVQGIGWALNEEYIYDRNGKLENPGFLDYRIPVASDLPMIETIIVEVPNPNHPYGVKGVAEANIVPPMAAIANAIENAIGRRLTELPMSPPKVLAALDAEHRG